MKDLKTIGWIFLAGFAFYMGLRTAEAVYPKPPRLSVICIDEELEPGDCHHYESSSQPTPKPLAPLHNSHTELVF